MARIELTRGAWAEVRDDFDRITNKERLPVLVAIEAERDTKSGVMRSVAVTNAILALIVTAWSFDLPLPSEDADFEIPAPDYDGLVKVARQAESEMFLQDTKPERDGAGTVGELSSPISP